ncbi:hypothetical protein [Flavobacterium sp. CSZ]|uniref:hypothetical protein n=1 Tax=Flavobacterium sp. CSZ TaxID=2783791 RepID=UPI00188ACCE4|nr:hypothetical protein [Flavobacterium sp. CSZ]MBF4484418.1 hypothetical protein [Flavobacterium sp. CSZ]
MNWKQLKDFCNSLPESELEKKVILWREDEAITDIDTEQLDEDQYIDERDSDNGCFPKSEAESQIKMDPEEFPRGLEQFLKVYDKGHPILREKF